MLERREFWKLVERTGSPVVPPRNKKKAEAEAEKKKTGLQQDELYNLQNDPAESKNVFAENAERAAKMKRRLEEARQAGFTRPGAGN